MEEAPTVDQKETDSSPKEDQKLREESATAEQHRNLPWRAGERLTHHGTGNHTVTLCSSSSLLTSGKLHLATN